jgi:hypothetical protein
MKDKIEKRIMDLLLELNNNKRMYASCTRKDKEGIIEEIKFKRINKHGYSN